MNESAGTPNDYCANLPSCPQLCAAAPEALEARFQPQGSEATKDSLRSPPCPQRKDSGTPPVFAIGPATAEEKPKADCCIHKGSEQRSTALQRSPLPFMRIAIGRGYARWPCTAPCRSLNRSPERWWHRCVIFTVNVQEE